MAPSRPAPVVPVPARANNRIVAVIAAAATAALLPWLDKPLFRDEGASLYSGGLSWSRLWQQSRVVDLVLLPYYSLLHLWLQVSDSAEWTRVLSLLAFGATVTLAGHLGVRYGGRLCGALTATLVATNPLMVEAALFARPYALSALTATASVAALLRWLEGGARRWAWWFCLASIATLLLQMFAVLVPLSALAAALVLRPRWSWRRRRALMPPVALLVAAAASFAALAARQQAQIAWVTRFDRQQLRNALLGPAHGGSGLYALAILGISSAALTICLRARKRERSRPARVANEVFVTSVAWAALPTATLLAVSLAKPVYVTRYVTSSSPGLALATAFLVAEAFRVTASRSARRSGVVAGGAAVAGAAALIIATCSVAAARSVGEDLQLAAGYLATHVGQRGEAALPDHSLTTGIESYLEARHLTVNTWPQLTTQPQVEGLDLRMDRQALSLGPSDVWLVDDGSVAGIQGFVTELTRHGYEPSGTARFRGEYATVEVVHYHRTSQ